MNTNLTIFQNTLDSIVREVCYDQNKEWRTFCLRWISEQLESVDTSGDSILDKEETPNIPEQLFYRMNEIWEVEPEVVEEIGVRLHETIVEQRAVLTREGVSEGEIDASIKDAIVGFKAMQTERAERLRKIELPLSSEVLQEFYEDAQHVTLIERIFHTNYKDVLRFQQHLCESLAIHIDEMIEWHTAKVVEHIASTFHF